MRVYVASKDQIIEKRTDGRGRLNLGTDYADAEVQVALLQAGGEEVE